MDCRNYEDKVTFTIPRSKVSGEFILIGKGGRIWQPKMSASLAARIFQAAGIKFERYNGVRISGKKLLEAIEINQYNELFIGLSRDYLEEGVLKGFVGFVKEAARHYQYIIWS